MLRFGNLPHDNYKRLFYSMCYSATVSFSAAAVLLGTGIYAVHQARRLPPAYLLWAAIPVFFAVQQAFEGRVWQMLDAGNANGAVPFALGFHFFSHFLWPWMIPLGSYLVEPGKIRKRIFGGCALFGIFAGGLVYVSMLMHPGWMSAAIKEHSIIYNLTIPFQSSLPMPVSPAMLYGLTILVPLLFSSHRQIRIFGGLIALSSVLASAIFNAAFVSVWCFFAALISLYLVHMIRCRVAAEIIEETGCAMITKPI